MNPSKTTKRFMFTVIAALLAIVLTVSAMPFSVFATDTVTEAPTRVKVSLDAMVNLMFNFASPTESYTASVGGRTIENLTPDANGWVTVPLLPTEMADTVILTAQGATAGIEYSVVKYAKKVLDSNDTEIARSHDTVRALLNYGAMTQVKWDHNTSSLANKKIFTYGNPMSSVTAIDKIGTEASGGTDGNIIGGEVRLVLNDGDIALKYTVTTAAETNALTASVDGITDPIPLKKEAANTYSFTICNVGVSNFANVWEVTIKDGDNGTVTSKHSVLEYLGYLLTNSTDEAEMNVCRTLYQLYQHCIEGALTLCETHSTEYYAVKEQIGIAMRCSKCSALLGRVLTVNDLNQNTDTLKTYDTRMTASADNGTLILTQTTAAQAATYTWLQEEHLKDGSQEDALTRLGVSTFDIGPANNVILSAICNNVCTVQVKVGTTTGGKDVVKDGEYSGLVSKRNSTFVYMNTKTDDKRDESFEQYAASFGAGTGTAYDPNKDGIRTVDSFGISTYSGTGAQAVGDTIEIQYIAFIYAGDANDGIAIANKIYEAAITCEHEDADLDLLCDECRAAVNPPAAYSFGNILLPQDLYPGEGKKYGDSLAFGVIEKNNPTNTDGFAYARYTVVGTNAEGKENTYAKPMWYREGYNTGKLAPHKLDVGSANYIVIKYKLSNLLGIGTAGKMQAKFIISFTGSETKIEKTLYHDNPTVGEWNTYVFDLTDDKYSSVYQKDSETGTYILDTLYADINVGNNQSLDIAYIAFIAADSAASATNMANTIHRGDTVCAHEDADLDSVCDICRTYYGGSILMSADQNPASGKNYPSNISYTTMSEKEELRSFDFSRYTLPEAGNFNIYWMRYSGSGTLDKQKLDVGNAKYLVIRLRSSKALTDLKFRIGSTGHTKDQDTEGVVYKTLKGGAWETIVIDLTSVTDSSGNLFYKTDTTGKYEINSLCVNKNNLEAGYTLDVAFMAFVDATDQFEAEKRCAETLPSVEALGDKLTAPSKAIEAGAVGDYYLFFTDPHPVTKSDSADNVKAELPDEKAERLEALKMYADYAKTSFTVCGGDWLNRGNDKDSAIKVLETIRDKMTKVFGKNSYLIVGNHDYNYQAGATDSESTGNRPETLTEEQIGAAWFSEYGNKTYYTFMTDASRFYVFNSGIDNSHTSLTALDKEQIAWYLEELKKNNDSHIVLAAHMVVNKDTNNVATVEYAKISAAYNARGTYVYNNVTYDFSEKTGMVEYIIAGHKHRDETGTIEGIPYIMVDRMEQGYPPTSAFVFANYTERKLYIYGIGKSGDRVIDLLPLTTSTNE